MSEEPQAYCDKCDQPCDIITIHGSDTEEFWGAPVQRPWSEDVSECCEAEVYEKDEEPENDGQPDEAQEWHDFDPDC